jgi:hypothetical protein
LNNEVPAEGNIAIGIHNLERRFRSRIEVDIPGLGLVVVRAEVPQVVTAVVVRGNCIEEERGWRSCQNYADARMT